MAFDQQSASATGQSSAPGFGPETEVEEESFDHIDTVSLLVNANWKARKVAYERCRDVAEERECLLHHLATAAKESNAAALESLLEALCTVCSRAVGEVAERFVSLTIDKALTGRPKAVQAGVQLLQTLVRCGAGQRIADGLIEGFGAKSPKVRQGALNAATQIVKALGIQPIPIKPILRATAQLLSDADVKVRKEAQALCGECYRLAGPTIRSYLGELREAQVQELEKLFESIPLAVATVDLAEEQPVLSKLSKQFWSVAPNKTEKWGERQAIIRDELLPLLSVPKINASDDYSDLVRLLKELINDPQMPLSSIGVKCIQEMAKSLRRNLHPYLRIVVPSLFEKFKDKKNTIVETMVQTFDLFFQNECCPVESVFDEVSSCCETSKVPHHRLNLVLWMSHCAVTFPSCCTRMSKVLPMTKLVNDEKLEIRDATVALIKILIGRVGDGPFQELFSTLDKKLLAKFSESTGAPAAVHGSAGIERVASNSALPVERGAPPAGPTKQHSSAPGRAAAPAALKVSAVSATTQSGPQSAKPSPTNAVANEAPEIMSVQEAKDIISRIAPEALPVTEEFSAKEWRIRADSLGKLNEMILASSSEILTTLCEPLVSVIRAAPGFKDSIVQVTVGVVSVLQSLAEKITGISPSVVRAIVQGSFHRLSDAKVKGPLQNLFLQLAAVAGPKPVIKEVIGCILSGVGTKPAHAEGAEWIGVCIASFQNAPIDAKAVVDFVKGYCFEQSTPSIKAAGVNILVLLRIRVGPKLDGFLGDINPHLKAAYEAELSKAPATMAGTEVREVKGALTGAGGDGTTPRPNQQLPGTTPAATMPPSHGSSNNLDADFPRTDLTQQLTQCIRDITGGADWKARLNGVKAIEKHILTNNKHVVATGAAVGEALKALKGRLDEPNKNLVVDVLKVMHLVVEAFPIALSRPTLKVILPSVVPLLADQKAQLRETAIGLTGAAINGIGLEASLPVISKALGSEALSARLAMVEILHNCLGQQPSLPPRALSPLVSSLMKLLGDRNSDIRSLSEDIAVAVVLNVGTEHFNRALVDLKPADQAALRPSVERILSRAVELNPQGSRVAGVPVQQQVQQQQPMYVDPNAQGGFQQQPPTISPRPQNVPPVQLSKVVAQSGGEGKTVPIVSTHYATSAQTMPSAANPGMARPLQVQPPPGSSPAPMGHYKLEELANALNLMGIDSIICACKELDRRMDDQIDVGHPQLMESLFHCLKRLCNPSTFTNDSILVVENIIQRLLNMKEYADRLDVTNMNIILEYCFDSLLAEVVAGADPAVVRGLNVTMMLLITNPHPDVVFQAMMHQLGEFVGRYVNDPLSLHHKYVEMVSRCLLRTKREVSMDTAIRCLDNHLMTFPPSRLRDRDDLSIRTVKSLLANLTTRFEEEELLSRCETLVTRKSLVYQFVEHNYRTKKQQLLQQQQQQQQQQPVTQGTAANVQPEVKPAAHVGQENVAPYPTPAVKSPSIEDLFGQARKHAESEEALRRMYALLQQQPTCHDEFNAQLGKCSDAFRKYLERKLLALYQQDPNNSNFQLPFEYRE